LDQKVNDIEVIALNVFQRVLLQSIRLSAFLKLSPKWRSQQNIRFILKFSINVANRIYKLGKKWNNSNLIEFPLTLDEVKWIATKAVLTQWTKGKISHRINERKALKMLAQNLEINVEKCKISQFEVIFSDNILLKPFNRILLTRK